MTEEVTWGPCGEFWLENICSGAGVQNTFLGPPGPLFRIPCAAASGKGCDERLFVHGAQSLSYIKWLTGSEWQLLDNEDSFVPLSLSQDHIGLLQ